MLKTHFLMQIKGLIAKSYEQNAQKIKCSQILMKTLEIEKKYKRGRKRFFMEKVYKNRMVIERSFAWLDSFRTLQTRYDTLDKSWLNWHYLAFVLILLKV